MVFANFIAYVQNFFDSKRKSTVVLLIFLAPLFFLNINDNHNWGDDFAQYLKQALNIVQGKNFSDSNYIYNPDAKGYAPPFYPPAYSLVLVPIVKFFGLQYTYLSYYNTLILVLLSIVVFLFFLKQQVHIFWSFILTLAFAYNPQTLDMKISCLSEITSTLFFMLYMLLRSNKKLYLLGALFASLAVFSRSVFLIIFVYEVILCLFLFIRKKEDDWKQRVYFLIAFATIYLILKWVFYPHMQSSDIQEYASVMKFDEEIGFRFTTYLESLRGFLDFGLPNTLRWIMIWCESFFLFIVITSMFYRTIKVREDFDILLVLNFFIISMYYYPQGIRYLYPFLPFFIYYFYLGIQYCSNVVIAPINKTFGIAIVLCTLVFFYKYRIGQSVVRNRITGVADVAAQQMFQYINQHYSKQDVFCFMKPRALALYTHVKTLHYPWALQNDEDVKLNFKKFHVTQVMITFDQKDVLSDFIKRNESEFESPTKVEYFLIYPLKKRA